MAGHHSATVQESPDYLLSDIPHLPGVRPPELKSKGRTMRSPLSACPIHDFVTPGEFLSPEPLASHKVPHPLAVRSVGRIREVSWRRGTNANVQPRPDESRRTHNPTHLPGGSVSQLHRPRNSRMRAQASRVPASRSASRPLSSVRQMCREGRRGVSAEKATAVRARCRRNPARGLRGVWK